MKLWHHQQVWFWLAAILIVCGAACLFSDHGTDQIVRGKKKSPEKPLQVARSQKELAEMNRLQPVLMDKIEATPLNLHPIAEDPQKKVAPLLIEQFHHGDGHYDQDSSTREFAEPGLQASRATLLAPDSSLDSQNILQTSVTKETPETANKKFVWFTGSIEEIKD